MDRTAQLEVFRAQTKNVRRLNSARRQVKRSVDFAIRRGDMSGEEAHCAVLALLYCAWLEALFSKIIHTPYGFDQVELQRITVAQDETGIHEAWKKCVDLGLSRVAGGPKANEIPNMRLRLYRLIDQFVQEPAQIRNKIAHGQWAVALNRSRTATNPALTAQIYALDIVTLDRWFAVAGLVAEVIEALVESPGRHFRGAYWQLITTLEEKIQEMSTWTRDSRVEHLRRKKIPKPSK